MSRVTEYADGIRLHRDLHVPHGSETIAANRYEPIDADGPSPAIVIATPYRKDDRITFGSWDPSIRYLARAGYEVIVMDLLGTGKSTGTRAPFDGTEGEEVASVIEWLDDREWTTGDVGTYGLSYGAWTQYLAAAENPDALGAIVPVAVVPSVYESSVTGGVFNLLKRAPWATYMRALRALPPSYRDEEGRWVERWHERLDELSEAEPWLFRFLAHETKDGFWADREVTPDEIRVPTLAACGYRDVHTGPMVEFVDGIDAPTRLLLGPWRHTYPHKGRETAVDFRRRAVEWFDQHLRGEETDALDRPAVTYWTERDGGWTPGGGVWRAADRWPPCDGSTTFALGPTGVTPEEELEGSLERTYEPDYTVGIESLDRIGSVVNEGVPTNADDARSLTFESAPLARAYELTGTPTASIRLQTTAPDPVLAVRILDVNPDGIARSVSGGYLRASHREGHVDPKPLSSAEEYRIDLELKPRSHVFETGHRIGVALSAGHFPRTLPPRGRGSFVVRSDPDEPSTVRLSGREHDGEVTFDDIVSPSEPDDSVPTASSFVADATDGWRTSRRHSDGIGTIETWREYTMTLPHGPRMTWENEVEATVRADDPASASMSYRVETALDHGTERVVARVESHVARDRAVIDTEVTVDGTTVYEDGRRYSSW